MHELANDTNIPNTSFKLIPSSNAEVAEIDNAGKSINQLIHDRIKDKKRFFGIEISPAANGQDLDYGKFTTQPLFTSVTWLFDDNLKSDSLSMAPSVQLGKAVEKCSPLLMHLTCYKLHESKLRDFLDLGFKNILALKGDARHSDVDPKDIQPWTYAIDLVKAIRQRSVDATIGVAGYPEVHRQAISRADDLQRLKEKVDAGANFIITNTLFSFDSLVEFIRSCRVIGITVPIIPVIFVPYSYQQLHNMCRIRQVVMPIEQMEIYERYKDDSERFIAYAIESTVNLLTRLFAFEEHRIYGIQFFTLNKYDHIVEIVKRCDFANK